MRKSCAVFFRIEPGKSVSAMRISIRTDKKFKNACAGKELHTF